MSSPPASLPVPGQRAVVFDAPAMGTKLEPIGLIGDGTIAWTAEALTLQGGMRSASANNVFIVIFAILGFGAGIGICAVLRLSSGTAGGTALGITAGAVFLGSRIARAIFPPKSVTIVLPWNQIYGVAMEGPFVGFIAQKPMKRQVLFSASRPPQNPTVESMTAWTAETAQVLELLKAHASADG